LNRRAHAKRCRFACRDDTCVEIYVRFPPGKHIWGRKKRELRAYRHGPGSRIRGARAHAQTAHGGDVKDGHTVFAVARIPTPPPPPIICRTDGENGFRVVVYLRCTYNLFDKPRHVFIYARACVRACPSRPSVPSTYRLYDSCARRVRRSLVYRIRRTRPCRINPHYIIAPFSSCCRSACRDRCR